MIVANRQGVVESNLVSPAEVEKDAASTALLLDLVLLLALIAQLPDGFFEFLNLDVLDLRVLLRSKLLHRLEQLLLLSLHLNVVRGHVFIFVLLEHFGQVLVETFHA